MIKLIRVLDAGNDVLRVEGFDDKSPAQIIIAEGWVSATLNHYDSSAYNDDGHLKDDATTHKMTATEQKEYFLSLLQSNSGEKILFVDKSNLAVHTAAVEEFHTQEEAEQAKTDEG